MIVCDLCHSDGVPEVDGKRNFPTQLGGQGIPGSCSISQRRTDYIPPQASCDLRHTVAIRHIWTVYASLAVFETWVVRNLGDALTVPGSGGCIESRGCD